MDRTLAALTAILAMASLVGQYLDLPKGGSLWLMLAFFTVLTNAVLAATSLARALGVRIGPRWALTLTASILIVAAIYHLILARLWAPQGLAWWADQGLHSAVPLVWTAWWLAFADKRLRPADVFPSLVWPVLYCLYALVRGSMTGFWPYPFLDGAHLSAAQIAWNILGLTVIFAAVSGLLIRLGQRLSR